MLEFFHRQERRGGDRAQSPKNAPLPAQRIPDWLPGSLLWNSPLPLQSNSCILTSLALLQAFSVHHVIDSLSLSKLCSLDRAPLSAYFPTHTGIVWNAAAGSSDNTLVWELRTAQFPVTAEETLAESREWEVSVQAPFSHRTGVDICRIPKQLDFKVLFSLYNVFLLTLPLCCAQQLDMFAFTASVLRRGALRYRDSQCTMATIVSGNKTSQ